MIVGVTSEGELGESIANFFDNVIVITSPQKVIEEKPTVVIHTFEIPYSEANKNKTLAWNINAWYAINIARAANKIKAVNVYLSTFMIFDGKKGYYSETSTPNPLNYYGLTKLVGESGIMSLGNYLIIRLGLLYSMQYKGLLFPFIKTMIKRRKIKCNVNFYVSPITVSEASEIISSLIKKEIRGVVNLGGKRRSIYNVCKELGEMFETEVIPYEGGYFDFSLDSWLLNSLGFSVRS
uniref:sugar nucleotide-binding protein n=1 Tax=Sulfurisphaera javensis TaxID=2049879 RepID=UPI003F7448D9